MTRSMTTGIKSQEPGRAITDYHLAVGAPLGRLPSVAVR
jgi:hypothetical protein